MKRCRNCGARCEKQMRYCKRCWAQVKAARESLNTQPAGARGIAEARNGEAEAVANAVGREAVAHGGCARILGENPRCAAHRRPGAKAQTRTARSAAAWPGRDAATICRLVKVGILRFFKPEVVERVFDNMVKVPTARSRSAQQFAHARRRAG